MVWPTKERYGVNGADMPGYLLDTNAVIYFFNGEKKVAQLAESAKGKIFISFITQIEVLCFEIKDGHLKKKKAIDYFGVAV